MRKGLLWLMASGALVLGGVASGALMMGCSNHGVSTTTRPAATDLSPGLNVLDARPEWGMNAAYKSPVTGHVVYLETRVGPLKPQVMRDEFPNDPPNEMDARVVDEQGRTITLVVGGDTLVDPAWGLDIKAAEKLPPAAPADVDMAFKLAREAGAAVGALNRPELAHHVFHVVNATRSVPSEMSDLHARANLQMQESIKAGVVHPLDTWGYHYLEGDLYGECIYLCVGHHSAVWGWDGNYDFTTGSWNWTNNIVACNHGPCANDSSMGYQASSYSGGSSNWRPAANSLAAIWSDEPTSSNTTYTVGHGCQTGYNWDTPPGHECNDDSSYELWQIHDSITNYGYGGTSLGNGSTFCALSGSNGNACSCSSACNSCSGDWSYPPAP